MATTLSSDSVLFNSGVNQYIPAWSYNNLLVNGDMRVSNALQDGQSWAPNSRYITQQIPLVDGWIGNQNLLASPAQGLLGPTTTVPSGTDYQRSILYTNGTANSVPAGGWMLLQHRVTYRRSLSYINLGISALGCKAMTLSFWVRNSLTGTYAATVARNSNRTYSATFTVNTANTWEFKTINIPADNTSASAFNNLSLYFVYGCGATNQVAPNAWVTGFNISNTAATAANSTWLATAGATYYIAGVTLEPGTAVTPYTLATQPDWQTKQTIVQSQSVIIGGGGSTNSVSYNQFSPIGNGWVGANGNNIAAYYNWGAPLDQVTVGGSDSTGLTFFATTNNVTLNMSLATSWGTNFATPVSVLFNVTFPTTTTVGAQGYLSRQANTIAVFSLYAQ